MRTDHTDVLIVGAGAGGGVAALRLAEGGFSVTCLEQGDWPDREAYPALRDEYELIARKQWSTDPNVREMPGDYPIDMSDSEVKFENFNGVGGSMVLYAGTWARLRPDDFRVRTKDGVAADWPISYEDVKPYYEQVERAMGVSCLDGNPACPDVGPVMPPLPIGPGGLRVARGHAALGWHWWPDTNAILSVDSGDRHSCVQRATCMHGCPEGAKASTDLTHWPKATSLGAQLITGARVRRVLLDDSGLAAGVEWIDRHGAEHVQTADVVILAASGVGTPRLLLNSAPDGMANSSGLVGRGAMRHPLMLAVGLFEEQLESWRGHFGSLIQSYEFYDTDASRGFLRGAKWSLHPGGGALEVALPNGAPATWGQAHHASVASQLGHTMLWAGTCEDLPEDHNRIVLSDSVSDAAGIPAAVMHYTLSENTRALMEWHGKRAEESLEAAGAHTTMSTPWLTSGHCIGTVRMGSDAATSVVDPWNVAHDVRNLLVVDASAFVTAGGVNPCNTICALALRAADHLIENRRAMPVPSRTLQVAPWGGAKARPVADDSPDTRPELDGRQRERLRVLADALIPAGAGMPAASEAGVADARADAVLAARPDIADALVRALAEPVSDADERLSALAENDPEAHRALELMVAGGYYLSPDVKRRLGYPGQVAVPVWPDPHPAYVAEGLLDHMVVA